MASTTVVYEGDVVRRDTSPGRPLLFLGQKFWFSHAVPQRSWFMQIAELNGAEIVRFDKQADVVFVDPLRKNAAPGTYSYKYVEQSIRRGRLESLADHLVGASSRADRPVGSVVTASKGTRNAFTPAEDQLLWNWIKPFQEAGGQWKGNEIYKQLEKQYPRHTFQSWRDRWIKHTQYQTLEVTQRVEPLCDDVVVDEELAERLRSPKKRRVEQAEVTAPPSQKELTAQKHLAISDGGPTPDITKHSPTMGNEQSTQPITARSAPTSTFTRDERKMLYIGVTHLAQCSPEELRQGWADVAQEHPSHSRHEWQAYFESVILPKYKKDHNIETDQEWTEHIEQHRLEKECRPKEEADSALRNDQGQQTNNVIAKPQTCEAKSFQCDDCLTTKTQKGRRSIEGRVLCHDCSPRSRRSKIHARDRQTQLLRPDKGPNTSRGTDRIDQADIAERARSQSRADISQDVDLLDAQTCGKGAALQTAIGSDPQIPSEAQRGSHVDQFTQALSPRTSSTSSDLAGGNRQVTRFPSGVPQNKTAASDHSPQGPVKGLDANLKSSLVKNNPGAQQKNRAFRDMTAKSGISGQVPQRQSSPLFVPAHSSTNQELGPSSSSLRRRTASGREANYLESLDTLSSTADVDHRPEHSDDSSSPNFETAPSRTELTQRPNDSIRKSLGHQSTQFETAPEVHWNDHVVQTSSQDPDRRPTQQFATSALLSTPEVGVLDDYFTIPEPDGGWGGDLDDRVDVVDQSGVFGVSEDNADREIPTTNTQNHQLPSAGRFSASELLQTDIPFPRRDSSEPDLDRWLESQASRYHEIDQDTIYTFAVSALESASMSLDIATTILKSMIRKFRHGKHTTTNAYAQATTMPMTPRKRKAVALEALALDMVPTAMRGCWTKADDRQLLSFNARDIEAVEHKHGEEGVRTRFEFLEGMHA